MSIFMTNDSFSPSMLTVPLKTHKKTSYLVRFKKHMQRTSLSKKHVKVDKDIYDDSHRISISKDHLKVDMYEDSRRVSLFKIYMSVTTSNRVSLPKNTWQSVLHSSDSIKPVSAATHTVLFSKINLSLEQSPDEDKKSKINIQHMQKTSFSLDQSPHMDKKVQKKPQYKRETASCLDTTQFQDLAKSLKVSTPGAASRTSGH
jgi:hypothetical protein